MSGAFDSGTGASTTENNSDDGPRSELTIQEETIGYELDSTGRDLIRLHQRIRFADRKSQGRVVSRAAWASTHPSIGFAKRCVDIAIACIAALAALPVLIAAIVMIKLTSRGPVFFIHDRIGHCGRHFSVWKLRTMCIDSNQVLSDHLAANPAARREWEGTHKLKSDPRVNMVGRILRATSIDELPQLWNVIKGDMSLVGPRPIVRAEINRYGESFDLYCAVRPGITGLWQVSGRSRTTYEQRVHLDTHYVQNWSHALDCRVLLRTVAVVFKCDGAY